MNWADYFLPRGQWLNMGGRINRQRYFAHTVLYSIVSVPVLIGAWLLNPSDMLERNPILFAFFYGNTLLIIGGVMACLFAKRLHDLGLPAVIVIPMLMGMPIGFLSFILSLSEDLPVWLEATLSSMQKLSGTLNTGIGFYLLLAPGEKGVNKYGPDPLPAKDELLLSSVADR